MRINFLYQILILIFIKTLLCQQDNNVLNHGNGRDVIYDENSRDYSSIDTHRNLLEMLRMLPYSIFNMQYSNIFNLRRKLENNDDVLSTTDDDAVKKSQNQINKQSNQISAVKKSNKETSKISVKIKPLNLAFCLTGQLARLELVSKINNIFVPNAVEGKYLDYIGIFNKFLH